jgi:hypothetical protein
MVMSASLQDVLMSSPLTSPVEWGDRAGELAVWGAVLAGLILVLVLFVYFYRSRVGLRRSGADPIFTLQDLRDMHLRGAISKKEFDRLRSRLIAEADVLLKSPNRVNDD